MASTGDSDESYIVVIGASAGGIDAISRLVEALPLDFPAPIVVAQHADPHTPSRLPEILQRQTQLQVVSLSERAETLTAGSLYLCASGQHLAIRGNEVIASVRHDGHPVPSIDMLFASASESYGDRTVAIILSGMGTDGVAGVRAVKERGGTVLVQEPESAAFPALPSAIPPDHIDYTAMVESLAPLLINLTAGPRDGDVTDPDVLHAFLNQLRGRTGIDFRQYKMPTIVRRLTRLMATSGSETLRDYLRHLAAHPEAYQRLVSTFLIKVTEFFRDPALFAQLRETILPELIANARKNHSELRLWSAGCATGEEAYSVAIALAELLGDDVETMPIRIFATDLDSEAIAFARRGIYPAGAVNEMPAALVAKYFVRVDDAYQIKKRIRNLTVFGEYDLGQRAPFPRIDLVLCRNVLIYFTKELQQRTLQLFAFSLRPDGYLILGKSETANPLPRYFTTVQAALKIFQRQGERLLIPAPAMADGSIARDRPAPRRVATTLDSPRRNAGETAPPRWSLVDRLGAFLFESAFGVVVVDRNYDIATINQAARSMLGIHGQGIGEDLVHSANVPSSDIKGALDAAFRNETTGSQRQIEITDLLSGAIRYLHIACFPDRTSEREGRVENLFVLVTETTENAIRLQSLETRNIENEAGLGRLEAHTSELQGRQKLLIEANDELTTANADLRSANEHLLISAEEAEAAAEEVETLNEEMQATSEELETLNEELQATVEELNTTNEELGARSNELEISVREREVELRTTRETLATLRAAVIRTPLALCFVDDSHTVTVASERYIALSRRNESKLPAAGERWKHPPASLDLEDDTGAVRSYVVETVRLGGGGVDLIVTLIPRSA
ncbi:MAG TPA: CheR family methyltransferase [Candidatus Tumulicola sp.]|jgi:two-component system CheB/CheR fusion protein